MEALVTAVAEKYLVGAFAGAALLAHDVAVVFLVVGGVVVGLDQHSRRRVLHHLFHGPVLPRRRRRGRRWSPDHLLAAESKHTSRRRAGRRHFELLGGNYKGGSVDSDLINGKEK